MPFRHCPDTGNSTKIYKKHTNRWILLLTILILHDTIFPSVDQSNRLLQSAFCYFSHWFCRLRVINGQGSLWALQGKTKHEPTFRLTPVLVTITKLPKTATTLLSPATDNTSDNVALSVGKSWLLKLHVRKTHSTNKHGITEKCI